MPTHVPLNILADRLRSSGVPVVIRDGAQGKSAARFASVGYYRGCQAVALHHTVSSGEYPDKDVDYLDGGNPNGYTIANAYVGKDGVIRLIASGPTYTEGRGGPLGIIPEDRGNDVCLSMEIGNRGNDIDEYTYMQLRAVRWFTYHAARLLAELWEWPDDPFGSGRVFAHHEWAPNRKIDPAGPPLERDAEYGRWDMDAFRASLSTLAPTPTPQPQEDDMPRYFRFEENPIPVFELHNHRLAVWVSADRWAVLEADGAELETIRGDLAGRRLVLVGEIDNGAAKWDAVYDLFGQVISA